MGQYGGVICLGEKRMTPWMFKDKEIWNAGFLRKLHVIHPRKQISIIFNQFYPCWVQLLLKFSHKMMLLTGACFYCDQPLKTYDHLDLWDLRRENLCHLLVIFLMHTRLFYKCTIYHIIKFFRFKEIKLKWSDVTKRILVLLKHLSFEQKMQNQH